jgi:hypothetical protein
MEILKDLIINYIFRMKAPSFFIAEETEHGMTLEYR